MAQERGQREHRTAGHSLMLTEVLQQVAGIYIYIWPWKDEKSKADYSFTGEVHVTQINLSWQEIHV